jgi:hypothetical protein
MKELGDVNSKEVIPLIKECGLTATSIDQGLTALRKSNFSQKWLYYQAFFLLSIGIERLLKLIVIVKSLVENDKFPNNKELKDYGHNIDKMFFKLVEELRADDKFLESENLFIPILEFISKFASSSRYYNLDTLSGKQNLNDPLHIWHSIQNKIKSKHIKKKEFNKFEQEIVGLLNDNSTFIHRDESDNLISNALDYFEEGRYLDKIQGYSVWYFYKIIDYLVGILLVQSNKKRMLPYYSEFFPLFQNIVMTDADIRKRKRWDYLTNPR